MPAYPDPPWRLLGRAIAVPLLLDGSSVSPPAPLAVVGTGGLLPGLLVVASYGAGSTLEYDEAAVLALVRRGPRLGAYVHRIWVDDRTSAAGGLGIWGLTKERAEFARSGASAAGVVEARAGGRTLFRISDRASRLAVPFPIPPRLRVFVRRNGACHRFAVRLRGSARTGRVSITAVSDTLGIRRALPVPAFIWSRLDALVPPPRRL